MTLAYVLMGVCIIGSAMAGCKEDLQKDPDYIKCLMGFTTYIQENMGDPSEMVNLLCGKTAKSKLECVFGYAQTCQDIFDSAGSGDMLSQLKNLDTMCAVMGGGTGMGGSNGFSHTTNSYGGATGSITENPCAQVSQCLHVDKSSYGPQDGFRTQDKTPFNSVQRQVATVCGPIKDRMDCLARMVDQCPGEVDAIREQMYPASQQNEGFGAVLKFISEECPKVPKTFSMDKCVKEKLDSTEFVQCYNKVANKYDNNEEAMLNCPAYLAAKKCVDDNVGKCGANNARLIVKALHTMAPDLPSNCEGSSASSVHATLATLITMAALCLGYVKF